MAEFKYRDDAQVLAEWSDSGGLLKLHKRALKVISCSQYYPETENSGSVGSGVSFASIELCVQILIQGSLCLHILVQGLDTSLARVQKPGRWPECGLDIEAGPGS